MRRPQRTILLSLLAWVIFSFVVASYHPPRTLADRVLVRAGRYHTWRFTWRDDSQRFLGLLIPGVALGGILLVLSPRGRH